MSMPPILQMAYDLKHQLDTNSINTIEDKISRYVDGVDTGVTVYERVCHIINFLEYCNVYPASGIQNYDPEKAGKEAYGNVIIED